MMNPGKTGMFRMLPLAATLHLIGTLTASAVLIDFEDGSLGVNVSNDLAITTQYSAAAGVQFFTGTGTNYGAFSDSAFIEQAGEQFGETPPLLPGQNIGFQHNGSGLYDTVSDAFSFNSLDGLSETQRENLLGQYFLRTNTWSTDSLVVIYDQLQIEASFEIWDIDGTAALGGEGWTVTAYNGGWTPGDVVTSVQTPYIDNTDADTSYDAQIYNLTISTGFGNPFDRFVIEFGIPGETMKSNFVGLAFNNFNTTPVPEPASFLFLVSAGWLAAARRRRV